ncbi:ParB/RepB/Spo0J family partition protein [Candidatus Kaiserbacteria bacterium]|nr:ParB/RepB/Spo0J family partition protein [Candidatus Kaiserbacteria bacterium]
MCAACVVQSGEPDAVKSPGEMYCEFHLENGPRTIRPKRDSARFKISLAKTPPPYREPDPLEDPREEDDEYRSPVPVPVEDRKESEVLDEDENTHPEDDQCENSGLVVASAEAGRAILEKVRIAVATSVYKIVEVERIRPMPGQPRTYFDPDALKSLAESIKETGQFTVGCLRKVALDEDGRDFELIDGERRWRAIQLAGLPAFRAMIMNIDDDAAQYVASIIANFNRKEHTVPEMIRAMCSMHDNLKLHFREIESATGLSAIYASRIYSLRALDPQVLDMLDPEKMRNKRMLSISAAFLVAKVPESEQVALAEKFVKRQINFRDLESSVHKIAKKYGTHLQQRTANPGNQRHRFKEKVDFLMREADDLEKRLQEMSLATLSGFNTGSRMALLNGLEETAAKIRLVATTFAKRVRQL